MTGQWPNRLIFAPGAGLLLLMAGLFAGPSPAGPACGPRVRCATLRPTCRPRVGCATLRYGIQRLRRKAKEGAACSSLPRRGSMPKRRVAQPTLGPKAGAVIKPSAKELAWLKIPWVLDLKAGQKTARAEARPIFLWVTGDEPLGRC
jgi:hypothetical protein